MRFELAAGGWLARVAQSSEQRARACCPRNMQVVSANAFAGAGGIDDTCREAGRLPGLISAGARSPTAPGCSGDPGGADQAAARLHECERGL